MQQVYSASIGADSPFALQTTNLSKSFGSRVVLDSVSLAVRKGEIYGFLGPNGAGKTTFIRILLSLLKPGSGTMHILGKELDYNDTTILQRVGAIVEAPALYPYLTGYENLRAIALSLGNVPTQRLHELMMIVGLLQRENDRVRTYSLGMRQRLGVAIAMINNPDLLVLDEPANGLDPAGIIEMRQLLQRLATQGKTVFISSHVLGEVQNLCTRVGIINQGKLLRDASVDELTHDHGRFLVWVDQAAEVIELLHKQEWGVSAYLDLSGYIITAAPNNRGRDLNIFLTHAGYAPDSLSFQQMTLEQAFMQVIQTQNGGR